MTTFRLARSLAIFGGVCALGVWVGGCGGGSDQLKQKVKGLENQLMTLRADADRLEERLQAVELEAAVAAAAGQERRDSGASERARLKVIRLAPDEQGPAETRPASAPAQGGAEDDGGARPSIRGTGDRLIKTGDGSPSSSMDAKPKTQFLARVEVRASTEW
jgi:hypothetical protein